jgi:transcriptional regulator with XRE-family HTH domain
MHIVHLLANTVAGRLDYMGMKEIRESRGLTHADIADMIGMNQSTVTRAENHASSAKLATFIKIAKALDVHLTDLFADSRTPTEQALLEAFRKLPPTRHQEWVQIVRLAEARDRQEPGQANAIAPR